MDNRTTPDLIAELAEGQVFVFGSNYAGRHGKGAALTAMQWGARYGTGEGLAGRTYALPTKGHDLRLPLSIARIGLHVDKLVACARQNPGLTFLVTEVGCGLAGYGPKQIAPLFTVAATVENIHLPVPFWQWLKPTLSLH
jgi:hypothetical protein